MKVYKRGFYAFANLLMKLANLEETTLLHDSIYDYELSNCIVLQGFTRVSTEGDEPVKEPEIHISNLKNLKIKDFVKPTPFMNEQIEKFKHLVEDVEIAIQIRRGSFSKDSTQFKKDDRAKDPFFFHASDEAVETFKNIIRKTKGKVFVSTDSPSLLEDLKNEFGTKIRYIDIPYTMTMECDTEPSLENLQKVYLNWFLLSMCPFLYITGGDVNTQGEGFSTYGFTAGIYGGKRMFGVCNDSNIYVL